ncbi:hypothetical protein BD410DRAFT_789456 [Rickenella mellea]|uniref:Uncharacterized protein n=1 Tax=Rickenella mellea TaxID=50990 RepID=A0A4Y7Q304_9AGAM|nr:hypothetical protein BD410DRAFT_789456 [Rickenella mellea]
MASSSVWIKDSTIDLLQAALERVKANNGEVATNSRWGPWVPDLKPEDPGFSFAEGRWLRELKELDEAMRVFHNGVREGIHLLDQKRVKASVTRKSSKDSIPNEVLSRIFETAYDCDIWDNEFSRRVSHVSRRFRMVALDTPFIWSVLHNAQSAEELETFLTRSRNAKLTVCLNEHFGTPKYLAPKLSIGQFLRQVGKPEILRRWYEFRCWLENSDHFAVMRQVLGKRCDLPFLQSMTLARTPHSDCPPLADACKLWRTPVLHHIACKDMILPNKTRVPTLKSAVLDFRSYLSSENLTKALSAVAKIEMLTIRANSHANFCASPPAKTTKLVELKSMTVLPPDTGTYSPTVASQTIFQWFNAHNLTKLTIHPGSSLMMGSDRAFGMTFYGDNPYPVLEELSVICKCFTAFGGNAFPIALDKVPSLRTLSIIGSPMANADIKMLCQRGLRFPQLRTLRLHRCSSIDDAAIRDVVAELRRDPQWSEFQRLELFHCQSLSLDYLKRLKDSLGEKFQYVSAGMYFAGWGASI